MTVYIEYAFLENFLVDLALLWLSLKAVKEIISLPRLLFSASLGAAFAVIHPLCGFSPAMSMFVKLAVGGLLPMLCFCRIKTKKEWGRYALSVVFFYVFTFLFGGAMTAIFSSAKRRPYLFFLSLALLTGLSYSLIAKIYQKRAVFRQIYECTLLFQEQKIKAQGFLDSGNLATKNALPVCFVSVDIFYDLCGEAFFLNEKEGGQVFDEMAISTIVGEKNVVLYQGKICIKTAGEYLEKEVYFAPSTNMITKEYKVLLHACILEE